jgi:hypothetical protein
MSNIIDWKKSYGTICGGNTEARYIQNELEYDINGILIEKKEPKKEEAPKEPKDAK